MDLKPSTERPLGYLLVFLSGDHLHNGQGKAQGSRLRLSLGKRADRNSIPMRKRVGDGLKFLTVDAYPLRLRVSHSLELSADLAQFNRILAGRQNVNVHSRPIVSTNSGPVFHRGSRDARLSR